ncbi:hypothetical protein SDJN03_12809, partial [Cucurbita argyrosperma subsp. sororia]
MCTVDTPFIHCTCQPTLMGVQFSGNLGWAFCIHRRTYWAEPSQLCTLTFSFNSPMASVKRGDTVPETVNKEQKWHVAAAVVNALKTMGPATTNTL